MILVGFCIAYRIWSKWAADEDNISAKSVNTNIPAELLAEVPIINNLDTFALHRFHAVNAQQVNDRKVAQSPHLTPVKSALKNPSPARVNKQKKKLKKNKGITGFMTTPIVPAKKSQTKCSICG